MTDKIDEAIDKMSDQVKSSGMDSQKAVHYSQAALNLANAKMTLKSAERQTTRSKGSGS